MSMGNEYIKVRLNGSIQRVRLVRRYRNGSLAVEVLSKRHGAQHGSVDSEKIKLEAWQEVKEYEKPLAAYSFVCSRCGNWCHVLGQECEWDGRDCSPSGKRQY